ncbi:hypothetical protein HWV62_24410 [Athelia sp. TMB]|nr:hypothetical protein HWV62_24410 [Athelia sp. TMB]
MDTFVAFVQFLFYRRANKIANFAGLVSQAIPSKFHAPPRCHLFGKTARGHHHLTIGVWATCAMKSRLVVLMRSARVTHVHHLRSHANPKREALRVRARIPATDGFPSYAVYFRFERALRDGPWRNIDGPWEDAPLGQDPLTMQWMEVVTCGYFAEKDYGYKVHRFLELPTSESSGLNVVDIASLACVVMSVREEHAAGDSNFAWFVRAAFSAIQNRYDGVSVQRRSLPPNDVTFAYPQVAPDQLEVLEAVDNGWKARQAEDVLLKTYDQRVLDDFTQIAEAWVETACHIAKLLKAQLSLLELGIGDREAVYKTCDQLLELVRRAESATRGVEEESAARGVSPDQGRIEVVHASLAEIAAAYEDGRNALERIFAPSSSIATTANEVESLIGIAEMTPIIVHDSET